MTVTNEGKDNTSNINKADLKGTSGVDTEPCRLVGILDREITLEALDSFDWEAELAIDHATWSGLYMALLKRVTELRELGKLENSAILELVASAISMSLNPGTRDLFIPLFHKGNRSSPSPKHLDERDVRILAELARRASEPRLAARLADLSTIGAQVLGVNSDFWKTGALAARSYLAALASRHTEGGHPAIKLQSAQRALDLGRRFVSQRKDPEFFEKLNFEIQELFASALANRHTAICAQLAEELRTRKSPLREYIADSLETAASDWASDSTSALQRSASVAFDAAAKIWNSLGIRSREIGCYAKAADALISEARNTRQPAMVKAQLYAEAIAILRRHHGDRDYIKSLVSEMQDARLRIREEMHSFSHEYDVSDIISDIENIMSDSTSLTECLLKISFGIRSWIDVQNLKQETLATVEDHPLAHFIGAVNFNEDGAPVARSKPFDQNDETQVFSKMIEAACESTLGLFANVAVLHAIRITVSKFAPSINEILAILYHSPTVPRGHELSIARGIVAGLIHDWAESSTYLSPQVEAIVRSEFKRQGVNTLVLLEEESIEQERTLNLLLAHEEIARVMHPGLAFELQAVLTHRHGYNLRNLLAHGLLKDDELWSSASICLWWLTLTMCLAPFRSETKPSQPPSHADL